MSVIAEHIEHKGLFHVWCEGCKQPHMIWTKECKAYSKGWMFNDDLVKPTFTPSLLVQWNRNDELGERRCHSYITCGNIRYLSDCTHELAGMTIPLKFNEGLNYYGFKIKS